MSHGSRNRDRLVDPPSVRLARAVAHARLADGVLHRQPGGNLPVRVRERRDSQHAAIADFPVHDGLPAIRGTVIYFYGGGTGESGDHRGALRCHLQVAWLAEGRPRLSDSAGLHRARGDGWRGRCDRSHDGYDRAAGDAQARLRPEARLWRAARRRYPWYPDPAFGDGDRVRGCRAAVVGRALGRVGLPGAAVIRHLHGLRDPALLHQSQARTCASGRGAGELCGEATTVAQHDHTRAGHPARARHHLLRHRDSGRSRRRWDLRRAGGRCLASTAELGRAVRGIARDLEGDGDGDVDIRRSFPR